MPCRPFAPSRHRTQPHLAGLLAGLVLCVASATACAAPPVRELVAPPGFRVELLTDAVPAAREMAWSPRGILYVGTREGRVHAFVMRDGRIVARHVVATGLDMPVGVAYRDGTLFISAVSRILRIEHIDDRLAAPPAPAVVTDALPTDHHHGWKFIAFGPDGKLYVPVGAPCNVCAADRNRYALIARMNADGSGREVFARGVRNTVGFAWHPDSGDLWFTDNGRDLMGDDLPDDELNRAPRAASTSVFHTATAATPRPRIRRPRRVPPLRAAGAETRRACRGARDALLHGADVSRVVPQQHLHCRTRFVESQHEGRLPRDARGGVGRRQPRASDSVRHRLAARGRLRMGTPADVLPLPDGSLLISDDYAGAIYRVTYAAP
jgi:glucose/arabinose dehydrogenase